MRAAISPVLAVSLWVPFLVFALLEQIGNLEGRLFPVVTPITLTGHVYDPPPEGQRYVWSGYANKVRECRYVGIEWNFGLRGQAHVEVTSFFEDPPAVREEGRQEWDALVIHLNPDDVLQNSHATVIHQCGWRPWETRTPFYDGVRSNG